MGWKVKGKRPEQETNAEAFYGQTEHYEKPGMERIQKKILMRALELAKIPLKSRVLDAGCGTGFGMLVLHQVGYDAEGFDLSKEMLAVAKRKGFRVKHGDLRQIPFPDQRFDAVVSISALQWVPLNERPQVAKEFARVLKPKGKAVVQLYPESEEEMYGTGQTFKAQGFRVAIQIDSADNPRKRKVFLLMEKPS
ncbi:class I SAM-dependent methyltransferase [Candidatus Micrarchaeota archaeon]|nr:class I SAM-dependent methyltransferase [Candidatus Micrarchaeota archaeon]